MSVGRPTAFGPGRRPPRPRIAVFGSGAALGESAPLFRQALRLGHLLGAAGFDLATGGYDGTMAAVSRGVRESGGHVLGVTLDLFEPEPPNAFLHEELRTSAIAERLATLCERSDAYAALPGGVGTLNEVGYAWSILLTGAVAPRPLVLVGAAWRRLIAFLRSEGFPIQPRVDEVTWIADTPEEAVERLREAFRLQPPGARPPKKEGPPTGPSASP
jgi:uncharacterized protein (TIGR00730 family)